MKFQYRSYREQNAGNRRTQFLLLILAAIIVGLVALNQQSRKKKKQPVETIEPVSAVEPVVIDSPVAPETVEEVQPTEVVEVSSEPPAQQAPVDAGPGISSEGTSPEAAAVVRRALEDMNAGRIIAARDQLNHSLDMKLSDAVREEVKKRLSELANQWLFSKTVYPGDTLTGLHKVQPGEMLAIFAKQYKVPHECIERINGIINPERLQAGQAIKIIHGPFSAVISKKNYTFDLYLQGMFVRSYRAGLGRVEHETPSGKWRTAVGGKLIKPTWTDPDTGRVYHGNDPDYPLGSRWIGLEGLEGEAKGRTGFAIHGTKDPDTIGTRASRGCIRLFNGDVVEVYDLMEPGVSEVLVVE